MEFLTICIPYVLDYFVHPIFQKSMVILSSNLFIHIKMKVSFYCSYSKNASTVRYCKYGEMGFLTSKNVNKHVPLALCVDHTGMQG